MPAALGPPLGLSVGAIISTLAGGSFALRLRARLPFVLAFTTGVVLGVVSFELLPETFSLVHTHHFQPAPPMTALVIAFLLFRSLEEWILTQRHAEGCLQDGTEQLLSNRRHPDAGRLAALALIGHSVFDGISIGVAFQISSGVGLIVAVAVIAHDFADGINTVSVMIAHGNGVKHAALMLIADALAQIVGALSTVFTHFRPQLLVVFLGFFAGFLLHVSTSASHTIAPEATRGRVAQLLGITVAGAAFALLVTRLAR